MNSRNFRVGIIGLESHGLADRSVAIDILEGLTLSEGLEVAFNLDRAFVGERDIWDAVESEPIVDVLLVSVKASGGLLLPKLHAALKVRESLGLAVPRLAFGGTTAIASPDEIAKIFPDGLVLTGDAEDSFPQIVAGLRSNIGRFVQIAPQYSGANWRSRPTQTSTAKAVAAGGTIWIEASRGCRSKCTFCVLSNTAASYGWHPRPLDELFDEVEYISREFGVMDFSFADFSAMESVTYAEEFIREKSRRGLNFTFRCDMRLPVAARLGPLLAELQYHGLRQLFTGVESFSANQLTDYHKSWVDVSQVKAIEKVGIDVVVGFIMLDPLMSPDDFRNNVVGVRRSRILKHIGNPHKFMRLQRGTAYEALARKNGILGELRPDLYTFDYSCQDPQIETIRRILEFFNITSTRIYYNNYIENMLRSGNRGVSRSHLETLSRITVRYKALQFGFLERLSEIAIDPGNSSVSKDRFVSASIKYCKRRRKVFEQTAVDYERLLDDGLRGYRRDLESFIEKYQSTPSFDDSILQASCGFDSYSTGGVG